MHASYHKDPMLQEHRLPRARGGGTATATATATPSARAAAAPRDPLQAQDISVRRRHLHTYIYTYTYMSTYPCIKSIIKDIHAITFYLCPFFSRDRGDMTHAKRLDRMIRFATTVDGAPCTRSCQGQSKQGGGPGAPRRGSRAAPRPARRVRRRRRTAGRRALRRRRRGAGSTTRTAARARRRPPRVRGGRGPADARQCPCCDGGGRRRCS